MAMLGLSIFCLLCVGAYQVAADSSCHLREVDLCVAIGLFHYQSNGPPADAEKLNEWCETIQEVTDCMGNYTAKCMSPLQKELMTLLSGAEDIGKEFCTEGTEIRTNFLKHSECLAAGADTDEFKVQMKDLQVVIEKLFDVPFKQRFALGCCGMNRYHDKVEELARTRCGEESVKFLKDMFKIVLTDMPEVLCKPYALGSPQCNQLLPASGTQPKGQASKTQLGKLLDTAFGSL